MKFYDRVLTNTASASAAGDITWTAAPAQHALPPAAVNETVVYTALDIDGSSWETGRATLTEAAGTYTLTRGGAQTVSASSNAGSAVSFTDSSTHILLLAPDAMYLEEVADVGARVGLTAALTGQVNNIIIPWTDEKFDDAGFFDAGGDTTKLIIPATLGIVRASVTAGVALQNFAVGTQYTVAILLNGTAVTSFVGDNAVATSPTVSLNTGILSVADGDYFQVQVLCKIFM